VLGPLRLCSRPDCARPAAATLEYGYADQTVWMADLAPETDPNRYDLCFPHADRLRVPHGWHLVDRRSDHATAAAAGR
jgi:hypothetical protein